MQLMRYFIKTNMISMKTGNTLKRERLDNDKKSISTTSILQDKNLKLNQFLKYEIKGKTKAKSYLRN